MYICNKLLSDSSFYVHPLTDIDECTRGIDGCQHNCNNNVGSFFCSCNTGYALTPNGKNCTGKYVLCIYTYVDSN